MPSAWCPHIDHSCPALQEARPECSELLERESQPRWETNAYYPLLFLPLYREEASLYRSLHFHVCIQGHFLNQSIEQSEYTIFMSQCILELKYMDGNKNSKALKTWQPRQAHHFILPCRSSQTYLRIQLRSLPSWKVRNKKQSTLNDLRFEFCLFSY